MVGETLVCIRYPWLDGIDKIKVELIKAKG